MWRHVLLVVGATGCQYVFAYEPRPVPPADHAPAVGDASSCWIDNDHQMWCWGSNVFGETGTGSADLEIIVPTQVVGEWASVSLGSGHGCAIDTTRALYCWGDNRGGATGVAERSIQPTPQPLPEAGPWRWVSAAAQYTCAVKLDGSLWCWGTSPTVLDSSPTAGPRRIDDATSWLVVGAGAGHTCAIDVEGALTCWGDNSSGQVGAGDFSADEPPRRVAGRWATVAAGVRHTCAIDLGGTMSCWGDGSSGQLGASTGSPLPITIDHPNRWHEVSAGGDYTCGLDTTGAWCWGANQFGQLALGHDNIDEFATQSRPQLVATGAEQLAAGRSHTCVAVDGALACAGRDGFGQLGTGSGGSRLVPTEIATDRVTSSIAVGEANGCVVQNGDVACWGPNDNGELQGQPAARVPVKLAAGIGLGAVTSRIGVHHACAFGANTIACWGINSQHEVSDASTSVVTEPVVAADAVVAYSLSQHTCVVTVQMSGERAIRCWGPNGDGQCGLDPIGSPFVSPLQAATLAVGPVELVAAGFQHSCMATPGELVCWGSDAQGQISGTPAPGYHAPATVLTLSGSPRGLAAGAAHTCLIDSGNVLSCWGSNQSGQLGTTAPTRIVEGLWTSVSAGSDHTCGIRDDQTLWCWGDNSFGQLGTGDRLRQPTPTQVGADRDWQEVSAGDRFTCALRGGAGLCWGTNAQGQIGDGRAWSSIRRPIRLP